MCQLQSTLFFLNDILACSNVYNDYIHFDTHRIIFFENSIVLPFSSALSKATAMSSSLFPTESWPQNTTAHHNRSNKRKQLEQTTTEFSCCPPPPLSPSYVIHVGLRSIMQVLKGKTEREKIPSQKGKFRLNSIKKVGLYLFFSNFNGTHELRKT